MSKFNHIEVINKVWFKRRDIISDGFDNALLVLKDFCPDIKIYEYPTGSKVWTWTIPPKWEVKEAWIKANGKKIVDIHDHPLHVMSYSEAVNKKISHDELMTHIHTIPENPEGIPFEFSYYKEKWGFCLQHNRLSDLNYDEYEVLIDSTFEKGNLKVGEIVIPGEGKREIILIAHLCHPCQVDDDLTGVVALLSLNKKLREKTNHRYSIRIMIVPETIGTIAHLANNEDIIEVADFGICLGSLGNNNDLSLQLSRSGNSWVDLAAKNLLREYSKPYKIGKFGEIIGNDEKVLDSPGVSIPTISLSRCQPWLEGRPFHEYHSSLDTPDIISLDRILEIESIVERILYYLDSNFSPVPKFRGPIYLTPLNLWIDPRRDPQHVIKINQLMQLLHEEDLSILDIAEKLEISYSVLMDWIQIFEKNGLIGR